MPVFEMELCVCSA